MEIFGALFYLRRDGLHHAADSITYVVRDAEGLWHVRLRNGLVRTAQLLGHTIAWLIALFKTSSASYLHCASSPDVA